MKKNELAMTAVALEVAKTADRYDNIIVFNDELGQMRVDTVQGTFVRYYENGTVHQYMNGSISVAEKCYGVVTIKLNGKAKTVYQHILMAALTQSESYRPGLVVGHKDSVKWNNTEDNLEWTTSKLNDLMTSLLSQLHKKYPNKYTYETRSLNLDKFIASKVKIPHNIVEDLLVVIDSDEAIESWLNYL